MNRFITIGSIGGAVIGAAVVLFFLRNYRGEEFLPLLILLGMSAVTAGALAGAGFFALNWHMTEEFHAEEERRRAANAGRGRHPGLREYAGQADPVGCAIRNDRGEKHAA